MITIPSGIQDPSYRYKMPKMQLKQESRLNGAKTNIFNIEDVASALRVPSLAIMKFMCQEIGTNMEKTSIIKGDHPYSNMLKHLDKFIVKYVICPHCGYPELKYFIDGKELKSHCNSCGKKSTHDNTNKGGKALFNYIQTTGAKDVDIKAKDKVNHNAAAEDDVVKKDKKKDKKDKDKKKKKDAEKEDSGEKKTEA